MFCLVVVVVWRRVSFIWPSAWPCIDVGCVLLASRYMIAVSLCLCSLYLREVLCPACGGCQAFSSNVYHKRVNAYQIHFVVHVSSSLYFDLFIDTANSV